MEPTTSLQPVIIPRFHHSISRRNIDPDALKVLYRLHYKGYKAYLVGGSVRDLLLGRIPKDFDVGTNATPSEMRKLFRNCRIIGRRFRIAHIYFKGPKIIEVSTFRRNMDGLEWNAEAGEMPCTINDSIFGEPYEDAFRRDLTINGLFYDIATFSVVDYVGGIADLKNGIIRAIGNPDKKFQEDPVRMIRVIRHAARTGFLIENNTYDSIIRNSHLLSTCNRARLLDEFQKDLSSGYAKRSLELLQETGLLKAYFPDLSLYVECPFRQEDGFYTPNWIWSALERMDHWGDRGTSSLTLCYVPILFPLLEQKILSISQARACHDHRLLNGFLKELTTPLGLSRKEIERLSMLWMGIDRLERCVADLFIPLSLQKKPYFQYLVDGYYLKWMAAGSSSTEINMNIQNSVWKAKRSARRFKKKRRVAKRK